MVTFGTSVIAYAVAIYACGLLVGERPASDGRTHTWNEGMVERGTARSGSLVNNLVRLAGAFDKQSTTGSIAGR